jgi:hypothetical protein
VDRRPLTLRAIAVTAIATLALGACGSDGPVADLRPTTTVAGGEAPTPTEPPAEPDAPAQPEAPVEPEAPAEPEAPVEPDVPAPPEATTPPVSEPNPVVPDEDDALQAFLVTGGLLLAAAVIILLIVLIARSRKSGPDNGASTPSVQSSLLSTSQWITDQLSLELMAAAPAAALQRWSIERSRLDNVAIGAQQQYLEAEDANWQPLAQAMSALAAAIDTNLQFRAQEPPNAQLVDESTAVVNRHRGDLRALIVALRPTIDR